MDETKKEKLFVRADRCIKSLKGHLQDLENFRVEARDFGDERTLVLLEDEVTQMEQTFLIVCPDCGASLDDNSQCSVPCGE